MMSGPLESYLNEFGQELDKRGVGDKRIIEEARQHLVDAVEAGQQRGLSVDGAEREAVARFGEPETVAAHVATEKSRMLNRLPLVVRIAVRTIRLGFTFSKRPSQGAPMSSESHAPFGGLVETVWRRKWWILVPTIVTAVMTSIFSHYFLPIRYQSEAYLLVFPPSVSAAYVKASTIAGQDGERLQQINQMIMSRTRLERIIADFNLYEVERKTLPIADVVVQMRKDIDVNILTSHEQRETGFRVSFVSSNPRVALKVTERLASLFVEETLRQKAMRAEVTIQFIDAQIEDLKHQIIAKENELEALRARNGHRRLSQAYLLPYEVLQETYKALLTASQESRVAAKLERRQIGEQLKIIDPARLPERAVGPSRLGINVLGGFSGLVLGFAFVGVSLVRRPRQGRQTDATST